jgi:hypothetical protein
LAVSKAGGSGVAIPKSSRVCQFLFPVSVAQEAALAHVLEAVGQHVQQEAANKLFGFQYHRLLLGIAAIILAEPRKMPGFIWRKKP